MCGIIGYVGRRKAAPILVEGLKQLEYRGYDSFGIATAGPTVRIMKQAGRIGGNEAIFSSLEGQMGIGHNRWATHGPPTDANAHPHTDCSGSIAVVHNGIVENHAELKAELVAGGHQFSSETDTEIIAHLIEEHYQGDLTDAVAAAVGRLRGSYAILVLAEGCDSIIAARLHSPLVLGLGDSEYFAASDITPILEHTRRIVTLLDGDIAVISARGVVVRDRSGTADRPAMTVDWDIEAAKKGGFAHFMLKEIFEQPDVFTATVDAVEEGGIIEGLRQSCQAGGLTIVACGSSFHAGMVLRYILEQICMIPVRVELASEFKYFPPPGRMTVMAVTQSGETADTIAALEIAKQYNCPTIAVTNVLGSSITRIADRTIYLRAGPEVSVAATKSFIAQLAVFLAIANRLKGNRLDDALRQAHRAIEEELLVDCSSAVALCKRASSIFYIGRGPFYPIALEGALKMKEISYIHAEGYAAGELKHGPFALLCSDTPVIALCTPGPSHGVMLSNIREVKARDAPVIAVGYADDRDLAALADVVIPIPHVPHDVQAVPVIIALQLLAYHTAAALGRDIDRPRNLAKSVTVE